MSKPRYLLKIPDYMRKNLVHAATIMVTCEKFTQAELVKFISIFVAEQERAPETINTMRNIFHAKAEAAKVKKIDVLRSLKQQHWAALLDATELMIVSKQFSRAEVTKVVHLFPQENWKDMEEKLEIVWRSPINPYVDESLN